MLRCNELILIENLKPKSKKILSIEPHKRNFIEAFGNLKLNEASSD